MYLFFTCSLDTLPDVCIVEEEIFLIQGNSAQIFNWEQYGLRITVSEGTLSLTDSCEVSVTALVGGQFQLPKGTELISAVYDISVSKPLLKPVELKIQHCADLVTEKHTHYLSFATVLISQPILPYQFQIQEGGQFFPGDQYGSISLCIDSRCLKAIVKSHWSGNELIHSFVQSNDTIGNSISREVTKFNRFFSVNETSPIIDTSTVEGIDTYDFKDNILSSS